MNEYRSYRLRDEGDDSISGFGIAVITGLVVLLISAVVLGGWWVGWWFKTQNTNRNNHLYEHEYGHQSELREDITKNLGVIDLITSQLAGLKNDPNEAAALNAQRIGVGNIVCNDASQINSLSDLASDQHQWVSLNCKNGNVAPDSPLRG